MRQKLCANCGIGRMRAFRAQSFQVEYRGDSVCVKGLSGDRCENCDEVEFDAPSARRYAAAGDELIYSAREADRTEIRRIRRKLGLSQVAAARLMGGGHNAFSRYERGQTAPLPAVMHLLRILDRHPGLLGEIQSS